MDREIRICDQIVDPEAAATCRNKVKAKRVRTMKWLLSFMAVAVILFVALPYRIGMTVGDSMYPTMLPYHLFVMDINPKISQSPSKSDIIVFEHEGETMVKRVVGTGADMIWLLVTRGDIQVVAQDLVEKYRRFIDQHQIEAILQPLVVPAGSVFVLGDNVYNSEDSRDYGPVPVREIMGKVVYMENWKPLNIIRRKTEPDKAARLSNQGLWSPLGVKPLGLSTTTSMLNR